MGDTAMTPKQRYDERKRLRAERLLREEQRRADHRSRETREDAAEEMLRRLTDSLERISFAAELWADMQKDTAP
jgi:hypothetical protein